MAQVSKLQPVGQFKRSQPLSILAGLKASWSSRAAPQSHGLSQKLERSGLSVTDLLLHSGWSYLQFFIVSLSRNISGGTETKTWGHARLEQTLTSVSFSFTSILAKLFSLMVFKAYHFSPTPRAGGMMKVSNENWPNFPWSHTEFLRNVSTVRLFRYVNILDDTWPSLAGPSQMIETQTWEARMSLEEEIKP